MRNLNALVDLGLGLLATALTASALALAVAAGALLTASENLAKLRKL